MSTPVFENRRFSPFEVSACWARRSLPGFIQCAWNNFNIRLTGCRMVLHLAISPIKYCCKTRRMYLAALCLNACFQFHPKVNCTAEKKDGVHKFSQYGE
jgi:hypothetical protein